ncbi:class I adenylate-forming enzyme family protein [Sporomusa sp. KB1]|uniref:class I adenylate-forming enzyme family protein n=1 Tax=Sporomusa sp. KB1 TaxID=943346 RepID=UPI0011A1F348|nr:long-chain-fatty-acid--CoA ligase [Sporomusa sp. KB1]TWH47842.1 long-chain acyl-CoA synthetase [Sporomusa sp. KB1]
MFVHDLILNGTVDSPAFAGKDKVSYGELQEQVRKYRNYFYSSGIRTGENVGLFSHNSVEFVYCYMAIASLGAIVVPINFQLTVRETTFIIKDAKMSHLITRERLAIDSELSQQGYKQEVTQLVIADIKLVVEQEEFSTAPALAAGFDENQPCVIIYTSGTTGIPKGAVLTHKNLVSDAVAFREVLPVAATDNVLCVLPMYHCFSWTCAVLVSLLCGASITILEAFAPKETIAAIKDDKVTVVFGVPPMYNLFVRVGQYQDFSGVRYFISGGASLPEKVAQQFSEKFGQKIIEGYGLSEASPVVALNPVSKPKYCSIGKALPGLEVRVADPNGQTLPPGMVGELVVRGPIVMKGYFNLPAETANTLKDGWLYTGDLAYQDSEGYFFVVDRLKDLIISNGENIYPREIEELLYAYPGIIEASVIGVADELRGQVARAYIVLAEGQHFDKKAVREYLHANIAAYKIPRDFHVVDALPKNQTGKILKRVLREHVG